MQGMSGSASSAPSILTTKNCGFQNLTAECCFFSLQRDTCTVSAGSRRQLAAYSNWKRMNVCCRARLCAAAKAARRSVRYAVGAFTCYGDARGAQSEEDVRRVYRELACSCAIKRPCGGLRRRSAMTDVERAALSHFSSQFCYRL